MVSSLLTFKGNLSMQLSFLPRMLHVPAILSPHKTCNIPHYQRGHNERHGLYMWRHKRLTVASVVKEQNYLGLLETCECSRLAGLLGMTAACRDSVAGWQDCWGWPQHAAETQTHARHDSLPHRCHVTTTTTPSPLTWNKRNTPSLTLHTYIHTDRQTVPHLPKCSVP